MNLSSTNVPSALCVCACADVVYVGVIHPYHLSTCLLFTNAKKNVLCEKPLAMNTKEVKEILASAKANNVFLMEVRIEPTKKEKTLRSFHFFFTTFCLQNPSELCSIVMIVV